MAESDPKRAKAAPSTLPEIPMDTERERRKSVGGRRRRSVMEHDVSRQDAAAAVVDHTDLCERIPTDQTGPARYVLLLKESLALALAEVAESPDGLKFKGLEEHGRTCIAQYVEAITLNGYHVETCSAPQLRENPANADMLRHIAQYKALKAELEEEKEKWEQSGALLEKQESTERVLLNQAQTKFLSGAVDSSCDKPSAQLQATLCEKVERFEAGIALLSQVNEIVTQSMDALQHSQAEESFVSTSDTRQLIRALTKEH
eukprot:m.42365 g.42365  ORF g.42365 m.42365 type:complete len:260 (+) comp10675_c1_seq2:199-978(+)